MDDEGFEHVRDTTLFGKNYWWGVPRGSKGPLTLFKCREKKIRMVDVFSELLN